MKLVPRNSIFEMSDFFEPPWATYMSGAPTTRMLSPRVDVKEKADSLEISAELPGVKKSDITISFNNGILTLEAESREENIEEKDGKVIRQERHYGKFSRRFDLDTGVQESDINAKFEDGLLTITVPRVEKEAPHAKRIEIH